MGCLEKDEMENFINVKFNDLIKNRSFLQLIEEIPGLCAIVTSDFRLILANSKLLQSIASNDSKAGTLPGFFLQCMDASQIHDVCGESENCLNCKLMDTLVRCQRSNETKTIEYQLKKMVNGELNLIHYKITSSPFPINEEPCILLTLENIEDKKRKKVFERAFFHDMINKTDCLKGLTELYKEESDPGEKANYIEMIEMLSTSILDEISSYRELNNADNNELIVEIGENDGVEILKKAIDSLRHHEVSIEKSIIQLETPDKWFFNTDPILLQRILTNMLKNALNTEPNGVTVEIGMDLKENSFRFWVRNPSELDDLVKSQIFKKNFTGIPLSIGVRTFGIKLLGETYLKGKVGYTTNSSTGTCFYIEFDNSLICR